MQLKQQDTPIKLQWTTKIWVGFQRLRRNWLSVDQQDWVNPGLLSVVPPLGSCSHETGCFQPGYWPPSDTKQTAAPPQFTNNIRHWFSFNVPCGTHVRHTCSQWITSGTREIKNITWNSWWTGRGLVFWSSETEMPFAQTGRYPEAR